MSKIKGKSNPEGMEAALTKMMAVQLYEIFITL
jgi:hypothetical protein